VAGDIVKRAETMSRTSEDVLGPHLSAHGTTLDLEGLGKVYEGRWAVRDLTLQVPPGALVALLGPSGCGKTTTLRMIAGLLTPDTGDVRLAGESVRDVPAERRETTLVFQQPTLFPHLDVEANVGFGLKMRRFGRAVTATRVREALRVVQLTGYERRKPAQLSGGQQQRVALARALVVAPRVLLLDEPLSSLDPGLRDEMRELIAHLHAAEGITTVLVTHDREEAMMLAAHIAFLSAGRLQQYGPPEVLYERPATAAVARFFGMANLLPATLDGAAGTVDTPLGALQIGNRPSASDVTQSVTVGIRPEHLALPALATNRVTGRVTESTYRGLHRQVTLACAGRGGDVYPLTLLAPSGYTLAVGEMLTVSLPPDRLHLLSSET